MAGCCIDLLCLIMSYALHEQICHRQYAAAFLVQSVVVAACLFPQGVDVYVVDVDTCSEVYATPQFIVEDQVARGRSYLPGKIILESDILLLHSRIPGQMQSPLDVGSDAGVVSERIARAETGGQFVDAHFRIATFQHHLGSLIAVRRVDEFQLSYEKPTEAREHEVGTRYERRGYSAVCVTRIRRDLLDIVVWCGV